MYPFCKLSRVSKVIVYCRLNTWQMVLYQRPICTVLSTCCLKHKVKDHAWWRKERGMEPLKTWMNKPTLPPSWSCPLYSITVIIASIHCTEKGTRLGFGLVTARSVVCQCWRIGRCACSSHSCSCRFGHCLALVQIGNQQDGYHP